MEMLLSERYRIVTASTAEDGLNLMEVESPFDIVISCLTLPGMNGVQFLRGVAGEYPNTVRILMTGGCGDAFDVKMALREGYISRLVLKPFCVTTLQNQLADDLAAVRASGIAGRNEIQEPY